MDFLQRSYTSYFVRAMLSLVSGMTTKTYLLTWAWTVHEGSLHKFLNQRYLRDFQGHFQHKPLAHLAHLTFNRIIYSPPPILTKSNFHSPAQLNSIQSWKLKFSKRLNWSTLSIFLQLCSSDSSVPLRTRAFLFPKPHNQWCVLWFFPALTFSDFLIQ